jgi:two-component system, LytTR family, response regulator
MIRCIVIDDEPAVTELMARHVEQTPFLQLVGTFQNPLDGVDLMRRQSVDLIFLDVEMPKISGIEFIKAVKGKAYFILCTAHPEYALDGFEHDVVDYLLKPVNYPRFLKAVQKAANLISPALLASQDDYIFIAVEGKNSHQRIQFTDIDFIESLQNYSAFHVAGRKHLTRQGISTIESKLPPALFARIHKSYIVPLNKISHVNSNRLILRGVATEIPIGNTYRDALFKLLNIAK